MSKRRTRIVLGVILTIHATLLAWGAYAQSPTIDEIAYLPSGLSHWQLGNFELANVSPPLVPSIAAVPLLAVCAETDWSRLVRSPGDHLAHALGRDFVEANEARSLWLFTLGRWALIPLSLLGAVCCYLWARDLAGQGAGLFAACLWCFCPNILAHAQLVTADSGATALGVAAAYTFWRWLNRRTWTSAVVAGIALGGAEAAKTTLLVFLPLWPLIWLAWNCRRWRALRVTGTLRVPSTAGAVSPLSTGGQRSAFRAQWKEGTTQMAVILLLAWYVLNSVYGFDGAFTRLDRFAFASRTFAGSEMAAGEIGNRFAKSWLGAIPVPLPEQYVLGIDWQKGDFENERGFYRSYLHGQWSSHGWWYYYLYCMAIKIPLGMWLLVAIAICLRGRAAAAGCGGWRNDLVLLAPAIIILIVVSSQSGFSMHFRYVLPAFPFAFVWISQSIFFAAPMGSKTRNLAVAAALTWSIASSLWAAPHHLSYFNELTGGPLGGHFHLTESNLDWGQDLLYLKKWIDRHPEARPMNVAYFGLLPPKLAGIDYPVPRGPSSNATLTTSELAPGWYAISIGYVQGNPYGGEHHLEYFQKLKPVAYAGYSICLYHIPPGS